MGTFFAVKDFFFKHTLRDLSKREFRKNNSTSFIKKFEVIKHLVFNYLKGPSAWTYILPMLFGLYFLGAFSWNIENIFNYKVGDIYGYLNNWLGYFIGFFGAVIAVAIFVISGIQYKNQYEEQVGILFRESLLFPLIYFSLTIIGIMLFVFFRPVFLNELQIGRFTILALILTFFELVLIAFLFTRAFKFIDPNYTLKKYYDDLKILVLKEIKRDFISKISSNILNKEFSEINLEARFWLTQKQEEIKLGNMQKMILDDFKIQRAIKKLKKYFGQKYELSYLPFALDDIIHENATMFWINEDKTNAFFKRKNINKLFKLTHIPIGQSEIDKLKQKLRNRIIIAISTNNTESFNTILDMYRFIVEHFAEKYNDFNILNSGVELSSSHIFSPKYSWKILYGIDRDLRSAFKVALDNNNYYLAEEIYKLIYNFLVISVIKGNLTLAHQFKILPESFLRLSENFEEYHLDKDIYPIMRLKEIIALNGQVAYEKANYEEKEKIHKTLLLLFNEFVNIMKYLIEYRKPSEFGAAWNEFSQFSILFDSFEKSTEVKDNFSPSFQLQNYFQANVFALWAWLVFMYKNNKIDKTVFLNKDAIIDKKNFKLEIVLSLYLLDSDEKYFWTNWEIEKPVSMKGYWKISTDDWLLFGMVVFMIKYKQTYSFTYDIYSKRSSWYSETIKSILKELQDNYESKWQFYFENMNLDEFTVAVKNIEKQLSEYENTFESRKVDEVIERNISEEAVKKFRDANCKRWLATNPIYKLFHQLDNLEFVDSNNGLTKCAHIYNLIDGKKWFVYDDEYYIHVATEFGYNHNKLEKGKFINEIIADRKETIPEFSSLESCFETLISELRQNNIEPNLIICNRFLILHDRDLRSLDKFTRAPLIGYVNNPDNMDRYDDIPIYYTEDKTMPYVIVARFEQAFSMKVHKPDDSEESIFQLDVTDFEEKNVQELITKKDKTWSMDDSGNELSYPEARERILTGVEILIQTEIKFNVEDSAAFKIGKIIAEL